MADHTGGAFREFSDPTRTPSSLSLYLPRFELGTFLIFWCTLATPTCLDQKVKVKFNLEQATEAQKGEVGFTLSLASALDVGGWSTPRPGRFTTGKDPVPTV